MNASTKERQTEQKAVKRPCGIVFDTLKSKGTVVKTSLVYNRAFFDSYSVF